MKKLCMWIIFPLLYGFAFADYSYTKGSVCTGEVCSTQTCTVTEHGEQVITTSETYTDTEVISELYDYLIDQGEDMYADWLMHLLDIQCIEKKEYTVTETKKEVPDPTEECSRSQPICGNGVVDTELGEECDKGAEKNGKDGVGCTHDCKLSGDVAIDLFDPISCDGYFQGSVDLPSGDYENVELYLEILCGDETEYSSLDPVLDEDGNYTAFVNYTDPSAADYHVGSCKVRYGVMYKGLHVAKEAIEYLEGGCKEGSGTTSGGSSTGGSTTGSSGGSNGGPVINEDGSITVFSTTTSPIGGSNTPMLSDPVSGPIGGIDGLHSAAPDQDKTLILDPAAQSLAPPKILEKTGAGGLRGSIF